MNHPDNQLPSDFRLTLDSHFVSSMILSPKYGVAPIRVVRKPKPEWYGSQQYFDRLDYIYVCAGAVDEEDRDHHITRADRIRLFLERAAGHRRASRNIVIAPEGECAYTEDSPQPFNLETAVRRGVACVTFVAWQGTTTSNSGLLRG